MVFIDFSTLTLPAILVGGAIDSINPCAIGVLIFLVAYLLKVFKTTKMMLLGAFLYISAVYVTYFLAGIGLLTAIQNVSVAYWFYWLATFIAFTAGTFEIKDYFWYGKGFSLALVPGASKRIKQYTKLIKKLNRDKPWASFLMLAVLGVFVVLVELPCTGAPYLAILAVMQEGNISGALPLLLLYNLIFVFPLFIIIGVAYFGKSSKALEGWRKEHRGLMRLVIGLFLLALGALMIISIEYPGLIKLA